MAQSVEGRRARSSAESAVSFDPMPIKDGVDVDEHVTPHLDVLGQEGHWSEKDIQARAIADVPETERGSFVPKRMVWPQSWHALIGCIRGLAFPVFWEIFAGACVMTGAFSDAGWQTAPPLDVLIDATMNLLDCNCLYIVVALILEGRIDLLWLAPPCATFSMALNRFISHALRSRAHPEGFPWLDARRAEKVRLGNALRDVACTLAKAQVDSAGSYILEQPASSIMLYSPPLEKLKTSTSATTATRAVCFDGAPWQKRTLLVRGNFLHDCRVPRMCQAPTSRWQGTLWSQLEPICLPVLATV